MTSTPETIGRYQVLNRIGPGGVSALYCAWDPRFDVLLAIKVLIADNDELRERFRREARSLAPLRHPHIACVHDIGEDQDRPFMAMEYVEGRTLADRIHHGPPLSTTRKLHAMRELCDGLAFAHRRGIVHGDVQPANIMFDGNDVVKIVGFRTAHAAQVATAQAGGQADGRPADQRSDIFAVGAVFYQLISGRQAFSGGLDRGLLDCLGRGEPGPPALPAATVEPDIARIIERCLEREPDRRFPDLDAVQDDLCRVLVRLPAAHESDAPRSRWLARVVRRRTPAPAPDVTRQAGEQDAPTRRGRTQMQTNLEKAQRALADGDYDLVISECEEALLLDSDDEQAFDLLDRARTALDDWHARQWLDQAEEELRRGTPAAASDLVERAAALAPALPRVAELRRGADEALAQRERDRQRAEAVWRLLESGEDLCDRGSWRDALEAAEQALTLDAASADAQLLKLRALEAIEGQQRAELERRVGDTVRESKRLFDAGNQEQALELLTRFEPAHEWISRARDQLLAAAARIAAERRDAERRAREQRISEAITSAFEELAHERFGDAHARLRAVKDAEGESPDIDRAIAAVEEAQAEAERAARLQREVAGHVARAAGLLARNDAGAALSRVEAALAIDPHHGSASALKARIQEAVLIAAERAEAEQRLAQDRAQRIARALEAAQLAASHAAAIASLNEVLEHDPAHVLARQLLEQRREAKAREHLEKVRRLEAERVRREQVNELVESARQALQRADFTAARALAQRALEHDARSDAARLLLDDIALFEEDYRPPPEATTPPDEPAVPPQEASAPLEEQHASSKEEDAPDAAMAPFGATLFRFADQSTDPDVPVEMADKRHTRWLVVLIASIAVTVIAGTAYFNIANAPPDRRPDATTRTSPQQAAVAAAIAPDAISGQVADSQARAEHAFARGDWQQGLAAVEEAFRLRPGDVALEDILGSALRDARARMIEAREAAQRAGAVGSSMFRDAEQKRREADRLARAGQSHEAIRAMWDGIQLLDRVRAETGTSAPQP